MRKPRAHPDIVKYRSETNWAVVIDNGIDWRAHRLTFTLRQVGILSVSYLPLDPPTPPLLFAPSPTFNFWFANWRTTSILSSIIDRQYRIHERGKYGRILMGILSHYRLDQIGCWKKGKDGGVQWCDDVANGERMLSELPFLIFTAFSVSLLRKQALPHPRSLVKSP
jgi:hypothetical protein